MDMYEKNNTIIVIVVAIFFLLVSTIVYNFYFKDYEDYNKKEEEKESLYVDITDKNIINELVNTIKVNNLKDVVALEKNIDNINVLEPIEKINIAYNAIKNDGYDTEIDVLELDNYFKNAFKTTIYWDKSDIYCFNGEILYKFDISTNKYIYNVEHNCEKHNEINIVYTDVVLTKKKNNIYVITVKHIWNNSQQPDTMYSSYNDALSNKNALLVVPSKDGNIDNEAINSFITHNYEELKDKLHNYTYIFEMDEGKYLLNSIKYE